MERLLLYVHYNQHNKVDNHVVYQLKQIRHIYDKLIFISNSQISSPDYEDLTKEVQIDYFLQRKNEGFDFAGWKDGLMLLGFETVSNYNSVTIMNDTCYGPLWDLLPHYEYYDEQDIDFWGMTSHPAMLPDRNFIPKHLQSYFIVFKKSLISSPYFAEFWERIRNFTTVQEAIEFGEIYLTTYFKGKGFKYSSLIENDVQQNKSTVNLTIVRPEILLDYKVPFIKVKAFPNTFAQAPYLLDKIKMISAYPTDLITNHLSNSLLPTPAYLGRTKLLQGNPEKARVERIAIVIFIFSERNEVFDNIIKKLDAISYCTDLFIITNNNVAAEQFSTVAFNRFESVQFFKNRLLWQLVDDLKETDFVGVFTIDSSNGFYEQCSIEEVHNSLLANIDAVATNFRKNPRLGLVFADLPMDQQLKYPLSNKNLLNELHEEWQAAKQQKNLVIAEETEFIEPPHKSFWLRTESLSQLADCKMNCRFAVYILWGIDMDYAIVANRQYLPAIFRQVGEKYSSEHQSKELDRMNFLNKCDYLFSPTRSLIKYELKKIILRFCQIYHR